MGSSKLQAPPFQAQRSQSSDHRRRIPQDWEPYSGAIQALVQASGSMWRTTSSGDDWYTFPPRKEAFDLRPIQVPGQVYIRNRLRNLQETVCPIRGVRRVRSSGVSEAARVPQEGSQQSVRTGQSAPCPKAAYRVVLSLGGKRWRIYEDGRRILVARH